MACPALAANATNASETVVGSEAAREAPKIRLMQAAKNTASAPARSVGGSAGAGPGSSATQLGTSSSPPIRRPKDVIADSPRSPITGRIALAANSADRPAISAIPQCLASVTPTR